MDYQEYSESEFVSRIRVERRKAQKPRIEKLRRDRINGSLNEIKNLVLEALNKDASRYSKMEKADILEMTVQFLKGAQAKNTIQRGIQSRVDHVPEFHSSTHCEQRHVPAAAAAPRNPHHPENQLHVSMNPNILPTSSSMPPSYTSVPMVTMAAQPTIVWLPYPSPPSSPTAQIKRFPDVPDLKQAHRQSANVNGLQSISLTSPSNGVLPLWRPW